MRIERVELFELRLPLKRAYETSGSRETHQTRVIARVESEGAVGWGESVAPELPWYSGETPKTVWYVLDEIIVPALLATELHQPEDTERLLAWIREHRMAKATLEMAIWDLFAKRDGRSLSKLLGGTRDRILCGVAIGIQPSIEELLATIRRELTAGYQRVKVKIKPGWDASVAEAIRNEFPDLPFMLDANSAYTLADAPLFKRIDAYLPMMIEQPLAHDDIVDHAALQRDQDADLPRRIDPHRRRRAQGDRARRDPDHQHQGPARWRSDVGAPRARRLPRSARSGVVRRHARDGHRPSAQRPPRIAAELQPARRCVSVRTLFRDRDHRRAVHRARRWHDARADRSGHRRDRAREGHSEDRRQNEGLPRGAESARETTG
jgi:Enolase C-terminal domain-like/Mandelate racemase / muconate lactonizing enzyme, N-terminal domain